MKKKILTDVIPTVFFGSAMFLPLMLFVLFEVDKDTIEFCALVLSAMFGVTYFQALFVSTEMQKLGLSSPTSLIPINVLKKYSYTWIALLLITPIGIFLGNIWR